MGNYGFHSGSLDDLLRVRDIKMSGPFGGSLKTLTQERQTEIARHLVKGAGKDWDKLSETERREWMVEASFCVSWLVE